jgi:hypothetical protein
MQILPRFLLIGAALTVATALSAQPPARGGRGPGGPGGAGPHEGPGRGPGGHPLIRVLDADHDREISASELANASAALLTLDTNGDGIVSQDELRPPRPADAPPPPADRPGRPADRRPPPAGVDHPKPFDPILLALDSDGDCALSAVEIANAPTSLKALDANGDGKLTPDEFMPMPLEDGPRRGNGRGPRHGPPPANDAPAN